MAMTLSRRLTLSAVISLALAALGSGLILESLSVQRKHIERMRTLDRAVGLLFDLRTLLGDYTQHGLVRARIQWLQCYEDFSVILATEEPAKAAGLAGWRDGTRNHETIGLLFRRLERLHETESKPAREPDVPSDGKEQRGAGEQSQSSAAADSVYLGGGSRVTRPNSPGTLTRSASPESALNSAPVPAIVTAPYDPSEQTPEHLTRLREVRRAHLLGKMHIYLSANLSLIHEAMNRTYQALDRQHQRVFFVALGTGLLMFLVVAALAGVIHRGVIGPVVRLGRQAVAVGHADLSRRVTASGDEEIDELGRAINRMLSDLERTTTSRDRLEGEVTRRGAAEVKLQAALQDLQATNRELAQFAYVASHDLQEPLRTVAGFTELLARRYRGRLDRDAEEYIDFIQEGTRRMHRLIEDLLSYSRATSGEHVVTEVNATDAAAEALVNLKGVIESTGTEVEVESLPCVRANRAQLVRVFQNLVSNAIKFRGSASPRIHIAATQESGDQVFLVRDNGIGIDPAYHDRVFTLFKRLHTEDAYPGSGIGLAVCKRIVERHGGRIWITSAPGAGSTIHFTLPPGRGETASTGDQRGEPARRDGAPFVEG